MSTHANAKTVYFVPHTHWDREWYQPFPVFQMRLVEVVDAVLAQLETDPNYRRFTLDGQAIILEDYLEVRPEQRDTLRAAVTSGRLRIGPWYVLADEFLVSPEALIRNLMLGRTICDSFGKSLPVAYTPDSFGHISQLPLIVRGFGLESIIFERGVGDEGERLRGEFCWRAADGKAEVFAAHLLGTYSSAAALGHTDWDYRDPYSAEHALRQTRAVLYGDHDDSLELPEWLRLSFERISGGAAAYATSNALLLLNGSDHLFPQTNLPAVLHDLSAALPELNFVHADVEEFVQAARASVTALETYQGEFRSGRYHHILSGVLSSRLYLKRENHAAESLLERYAEPLAALAWTQGASYPQAFLWRAWRELLKNHPHDSICGCSVDAVHRAMQVRFAEVNQRGQRIAEQALASLAQSGNVTALTVFQPLPYAQTVCVTHELELPAGSGEHLRVIGKNGTVLPSQVQLERVFAAGRSDTLCDRVTLRFLASLPPAGVEGFTVTALAAPCPQTSLRVSTQGTQAQLENDLIRLEVAADGKLTLFDKRFGYSYPLELAFEDEADAGDSYDFSALADDTVKRVSQLAAPPKIAEQGAVRAALDLHYDLALPEKLSPDRRVREGEVTLPLTLTCSLEAESPVVRLTVQFDNVAADHRLRLRVATGCASEHVWADGHFDVLQRPLALPSGDGWFQSPQGTSHQRRFVAVSDGAKGLAVLNKGLPEYEAVPSSTGVDLVVTLVRAVGWLSRADLASRPQGAGPSMETPEAQCPGAHTCELALYPFAGPWWEGGVVEVAEAFTLPPYAQTATAQASTQSWLELSPPLLLSSLKRAEERGSLIVRVWNPAPQAVSGVLRLGLSCVEAYAVSLAEVRIEPLTLTDAALDLTLRSKEVLTLEFVLGEEVTMPR